MKITITLLTLMISTGCSAQCLPDETDPMTGPEQIAAVCPDKIECGWRYNQDTDSDECLEGFVRVEQIGYQAGTKTWYHDTACVLPDDALLPFVCFSQSCRLGFVTGSDCPL